MEPSTISRVLENLHCLLQNRGYDMSQINHKISESHLYDKIERFAKDNTSLDIFLNKPKKMFVKFLPKVGDRTESAIKDLEKIYKIVSDAHRFNQDDEFIFVVLDDVKKDILNIENIYQNVTIFPYKRLLVNIVDSIYVPKHTRLSIEEKRNLKNNLSIESFTNLPIIFKSDAVCRYYNFRQGDVLKIERPSKGNMKHIVYRYVTIDDEGLKNI